jgi:hypothetical protein
MKTLRIFPRKTKATPDDKDVRIDCLPSFFDSADRVEVSVAFTVDRAKAEKLAHEWEAVAPVTIGGPAYNDAGGEFEPGRYLRHGYVITSRGCPNKCPRCLVPIREGALRLLKINDGWNLLDNNILACPDYHIKAVFAMLARQPQRPELTGGIDASLLKPWHVDAIASLRPKSVWTAYDHPGEYDALRNAAAMFADAGLINGSHTVGAYVLMGWCGDTPEKAEERCRQVIALGIRTQAMLLNGGDEVKRDDYKRWRDLRRHYTNAATVGSMIAEKARIT